MWSKIDEIGHHYRRYDKNTLSTEIEEEGFEYLYSSYFMTLLFPFVFIYRKIVPFLFFKKAVVNDLYLKSPINILDKISTLILLPVIYMPYFFDTSCWLT